MSQRTQAEKTRRKRITELKACIRRPSTWFQLPIRKGSVTTKDIDKYAKDEKNSLEGIDRSVLLRIHAWKHEKTKSGEFLSINTVRECMLEGARYARKFIKDYLDIEVFLDPPAIYDVNSEAAAKLKGGPARLDIFEHRHEGDAEFAETVADLCKEVEKAGFPVSSRFLPFVIDSSFYILLNHAVLTKLYMDGEWNVSEAKKSLFIDGFRVSCRLFIEDYFEDTGEMEGWEFEPPEYLAFLPRIIALDTRSVKGRVKNKWMIKTEKEQLFKFNPGIEDLYNAIMKKYRTPERACEFLKAVIHNFGTNMKASLLLANAEEPQDLVKYLDELGELLGVE